MDQEYYCCVSQSRKKVDYAIFNCWRYEDGDCDSGYVGDDGLCTVVRDATENSDLDHLGFVSF